MEIGRGGEDDPLLTGGLLLGLAADQTRTVGGDDVAGTGEELVGDLVEVLEGVQRDVDAEAGGQLRDVGLGGRAGVGADDRAIDLGDLGLGTEAVARTAHQLLTVVVGGRTEVHAHLGVTALGPGAVAHEHVDIAGLDGGEALGGGQRDELDGIGIAEHGGGDGTAVVGVDAGDRAVGLRERERHGGAGDAAVEGAPSLDGGEDASVLGELDLITLGGLVRRCVGGLVGGLVGGR